MNPFTYINHATWLQERHKGIGASEIAILCGQSNFMTPLELWEIKTGKIDGSIKDDSLKALMQAGKDQEPITLLRFLKSTNSGVENLVLEKYYKKQTLLKKACIQIFTKFQFPNHPYMFAHPDMIYNDLNIEAKYIKYKHNEWNFDDLTENGIPFKYYLQIQFQMMCTGLKKTILCANYLGAEHYEFKINVNTDLFPTFEKLCFDFWKLVEKKEPPMPTSRADVKKLFPKKNFKSLTLPDEIATETIMQKDRYDFLKKRIGQMKKEQENIKASVMSLMTENNVLQTADGEQIAKISEWPEERIKALSKIKTENLKVYKYLQKNKMINIIDKSRFNF